MPTTVTGTDNLNYSITDGKGDVIIVSGFNLTATNSAPATIIPNPRVDDTDHTHRLREPRTLGRRHHESCGHRQ